MSQSFRTNSNKQHYPLHPSKGVNEADFKEGSISVTGIGGPRRQFSRAAPSSEIAHIKTQANFLKSLNNRLAASKASGNARKEEKKHERAERNKEADKNLELANKFMERQEKLRRGENPPPVDVVVNVESGPTLPKNLSEQEKKNVIDKKLADTRKEESVIRTMTEPVTVEQPSSPAMVTTPNESVTVQPVSTVSTNEKKPQQKKSDLSLSELALMRFPAKG